MAALDKALKSEVSKLNELRSKLDGKLASTEFFWLRSPFGSIASKLKASFFSFLLLLGCVENMNSAFDVNQSALSFGRIIIETACVENGLEVDQSSPFSFKSAQEFNPIEGGNRQFMVFPEKRFESESRGSSADGFQVLTKLSDAGTLEIWFQFDEPRPGYCAHIIRSSSNAFAFASADEVLSSTIDLTETNSRLVASIERRINDCNAVIGDIAFAPRDCKIDRVGLEVVATAGCYCDGPEIGVPIRAARLYLKVDEKMVILTILNDEVFLDSEE